MRCSMKRFRREDDGQAIVLIALALLVLLLMAGLGVDVAYLRYQKQQMQKAADAGAIAGAVTLIYNDEGSSSVTAAAKSDTAANGYTDGVDGISVQVNNPPNTEGDPFQGESGYVEVIVAQTRPAFFMQVGGFESVNVRSRAVAGMGLPADCIYALDPYSSDSFHIQGNVTITSLCGILIKSRSSSALHGVGGSYKINAQVGIVGGYDGNATIVPPPVEGIASFNDPLAGTPAPTYDAACTYIGKTITGNGITSLAPGTYCNGITISGGGVVNFAGGTYVLLGGGMTVTGSPKLVGTGVLFYDTGNAKYPYGPIKMTGTAGTTLSAPTTGDQAGILFFQDRDIPEGSITNTFDGTNGQVYNGALYFPTTVLQYKGTPSVSEKLIIVGWHLDFRGDVNLTNYRLPDGSSPIKSAMLVE